MDTSSARPRPASSETPQSHSGTKSVAEASLCTAPFLSLCKSKYLIPLCLCVIYKEFEIELEGSQYLRILCYEKCYDKSRLNKDDNEIVDKIMGKGQVQVRKTASDRALAETRQSHGTCLCSLGDVSQHVTHFN